MSKPFDAALKELVERYPQDWLALLGLPSTVRVEALDTDVSTVSAQADRVLLVMEPAPWILQVELQAGRDLTLPKRILKYNVLLHVRHEVHVRSAVVLLTPRAETPGLTGVYEYPRLPDLTTLSFHYQVARVWEWPVDAVLAGGLGTLPLAPLAKVEPDSLPDVLRAMERRLSTEVPAAEAAELWTAAFVLTGLRYSPDTAQGLFRRVRAMKESATYQAIVAEGLAEGMAKGMVQGMAQGMAQGRTLGEAEGRAHEARRVLLLLGGQRFGAADPGVQVRLESIQSAEVLEGLLSRLLTASSWEDLLGTIQ